MHISNETFPYELTIREWTVYWNKTIWTKENCIRDIVICSGKTDRRKDDETIDNFYWKTDLRKLIIFLIIMFVFSRPALKQIKIYIYIYLYLGFSFPPNGQNWRWGKISFFRDIVCFHQFFISGINVTCSNLWNKRQGKIKITKKKNKNIYISTRKCIYGYCAIGFGTL